MQEVKTLFERKELIIYGETSWKWDGFQRGAVERLAPGKAGEIDKLAKKEADKQAKELQAKKDKEQKEFQALVDKIKSDDFDVVYGKGRAMTLKKGGVSASIDHEDKVWDGWSSHTTNKPWRLYFNYKTVRYATLNNAINKAAKKIDQKLEDIAERKKLAAKRNTSIAEKNMELVKRKSGLKVRYSPYGRYYNRYKIVSILKSVKDKNYSFPDTAELEGSIWDGVLANKTTDQLKIGDVKIKGILTVKGMIRLEQLLKTMAKDGDIKVT